MLFAKKKTTSPQEDLTFDRQFVFIEVPIDIVGPESLLWGEASWWPKNSLIRFRRTSQQELGVGATYEINLNFPIPQKSVAEVTQYEPGRLVVRTFKEGFFKGSESVRAEERANGTRVEYEMRYMVSEPVKKIFWDLFLRKSYIAAINKVFLSLQAHCVKKIEPETL